jgi:hypothetical protein
MGRDDDDSDDDDDDPPTPRQTSSMPIPSHISTTITKSATLPLVSSTATALFPLNHGGNLDSVGKPVSTASVDSMARHAASPNELPLVVPVSEASHHSDDGINDARITAERTRRWADLLALRPANKDGDSMSSWLMQVLAVSDLTTPLLPAEDIVGGALSTAMDVSNSGKSGTNGSHYDGNPSVPGTASVGDNVVKGMGKSKGLPKKTIDGKPSSAAGGSTIDILKKKRSLPSVGHLSPKKDDSSKESDTAGAAPVNTYGSGSFAEWKERKKQKKAMMKESSAASSPESTPPSPHPE